MLLRLLILSFVLNVVLAAIHVLDPSQESLKKVSTELSVYQTTSLQPYSESRRQKRGILLAAAAFHALKFGALGLGALGLGAIGVAKAATAAKIFAGGAAVGAAKSYYLTHPYPGYGHGSVNFSAGATGGSVQGYAQVG